MKKRNRLWLPCLVAVLGASLGAAGESPKIGEPAPTFVAKTFEGADFYLRDYCGQPRGSRHRQVRNILVLSFFATWCQPCRQEMPMLQELASKYRDDGVLFYLVNDGQSRDTVEAFLYEQVVNLPVILDPFEVLAKKFSVRELPTLAVINRDGILAEYHSGYHPEYQKTLTYKLDSLLGRKPAPEIKGRPDDRAPEGKANRKKKTKTKTNTEAK